MTFDELDQEIVLIKRKGLTPFVEQNLIKQVRKDFYSEKLKKDQLEMFSLLHRNIRFLERQYKTYANSVNIQDYLGINISHMYKDWYMGNMSLGSFEFFLYIAYFFSIPVEILMFTDLEANENTIKKQYPLIFKQSRY